MRIEHQKRMPLLTRRRFWSLLVLWCIAIWSSIWSLTYIKHSLHVGSVTAQFLDDDGLSVTNQQSAETLFLSKRPGKLPVQEKGAYFNAKVIQEEMSRRKDVIKQFCENYHSKQPGKKSQYSKEYLSHIIVNRENKIMYCFVPKVANTNFRRLFLHLQGTVSKEEMPKITGYEIYTKYLTELLYLENLYEVQRRKLLKDYKKVIFVREPLERLLSAYRNKFYHPNPDQRKPFIRKYQEFYKSHPKKIRKNLEEKPLTFQEFLDYWVDSFEQHSFMNEHFVPSHELCNPCEIHYDFIGKYENLQIEVPYFFQSLGIDIEFPQRNDNYSMSSTHDLVESYYQDVPNWLFKRVWNFLQKDSQLFGYSLPPWAVQKLA